MEKEADERGDHKARRSRVSSARREEWVSRKNTEYRRQETEWKRKRTSHG